MADTTADDVYDDPDNILADTDDGVDGATELVDGEDNDLSQSVYLPEKDGDDRGAIDGLGPHNDPDSEGDDEAQSDFVADEDGIAHSTGQGSEDAGEDVDSARLGGQIPDDERDGTDPA